MRVTRCSTTRSEAFLAVLRVLLVLRVAGFASSLLLVLLSHKCNEASFFVPCAAQLPHVFSPLSEHSPTSDTVVGFGLLPRERRRFGYESKSVVILFLHADSPRFAHTSSARNDSKNDLLVLVLRRALDGSTPPQLREKIQGEDGAPFLFHSRRLGSQLLDIFASRRLLITIVATSGKS